MKKCGPVKQIRSKPQRAYGKIIWGSGSDRWQFNDPENPALGARLRRMSDEEDLLPRDVICDWLYLVFTCQTTKLAQQKLAAIRAAVRSVPPPWPEEER